MKFIPEYRSIAIKVDSMQLLYFNTMHAIKDMRKAFGITLGKRKMGDHTDLDNIERLLLSGLHDIGIDPGAEWGHQLDLTNLEN